MPNEAFNATAAGHGVWVGREVEELLGDADGAMEELGACVALAGKDLVVRGAAHLALGRLRLLSNLNMTSYLVII